MLLYEQLTQEEKDYLTDGCGNKFLNVPDLEFGEACRRHDFAYWRGHSKADRLRYDIRWYNDMVAAANKYGWFKRNSLIIAAKVYYRAVRMFSGVFFDYGNRYKTREDLRKEMEE